MHKQNNPDSTSSVRTILTTWIMPEPLSSFLIGQGIPRSGTDKEMLLCIENLLESSPYLWHLCCSSAITSIYFCLQGFYLGIKLRISIWTLLVAKCQRLRYAPGANLTDAGPCFTFYKHNKETITVDLVSIDSLQAPSQLLTEQPKVLGFYPKWNIKWHISRGCEWPTRNKGQLLSPITSTASWSTWRMGSPVWFQEHLGAVTDTALTCTWGQWCHCQCRCQAAQT